MKRRILVYGLLLVIVYVLWHGPDDAQINLMTGNLRYRVFRIPYLYQNLPFPYSDWLRAISSKDNRWVTVATFPLRSSNNSQLMCQGFYKSAAAWTKIDPKIAKAVLSDVETFINSTGAASSLPDSYPLLNRVCGLESANPQFVEGWETDPRLRDYLDHRDLHLPSTPAADAQK